MVLLIGDEDIKKAELTPEEVIGAVEDAYRQDGMGFAQDTPRREIRTKGKDLPHIAPGTESIGQGLAFLEKSKVVVVSHAFHFSWHRYVTMIIDPKGGKTLAIISRERAPFGEKQKEAGVGDLRTGAAAAIGAKYLARKHIESVGLLGTGNVGRGSLTCLSKVRSFDRLYVHSGRRKDVEFAAEMGRMLGVDVHTPDDPRDVVNNADILITATYATTPIVMGEWLKEGSHISGMGSDDPLKAELDLTTFKRADKIVVDGEKCLTTGELAHPIHLGAITQADIYGKISEIVAGKKSGRSHDGENTIFMSDGTNLQSAGVSYLIYTKVKKMGLGRETSTIPPNIYNT
jgi:ornithine cyclodeaminase/alanine dehydrogenase-like protein (mu-crystallin family)